MMAPEDYDAGPAESPSKPAGSSPYNNYYTEAAALPQIVAKGPQQYGSDMYFAGPPLPVPTKPDRQHGKEKSIVN